MASNVILSGKISLGIQGFVGALDLFALLPPTSKNVGYNVLDLLAKNLFGVVLSV